MNDRDKYLGQMSFHSKVIVRTDRHTHTHPTQCSIWTTNVVGNKTKDITVDSLSNMFDKTDDDELFT